MLDWTDRHCRFFLRQISHYTLLYTEMVTTGAILHGNAQRHLGFHEDEHPVALQLGGSDPQQLASCSKIAEEFGYDEINLNVGCPSDRVKSGSFGACLMAEPQLVRDCLGEMQNKVNVPVTVKHRIGIDRDDSYEQLNRFVEIVKQSGIETFIIHARKAWLDGLSPKENRDVPPLRYDAVYDIKQDHPNLEIIINGGINTLQDAKQQLTHVDGVMMGRAIYHNPWLLVEADNLFFDKPPPVLNRRQVIEKMIPYIEEQMSDGAKLKHIARHMLGLFQGVPGAKAWRRHISENAYHADANTQVLMDAASKIADD